MGGGVFCRCHPGKVFGVKRGQQLACSGFFSEVGGGERD